MKDRCEHESATVGSQPVRSGALSALLHELAHAPMGEGSDWHETLRPGVVIGRFELIRELGRGGFGVVFEARDRELGRAVAFKALRGDARPDVHEERLLREAEAAARLSHPNIVTLYDVGRGEHGPYLILELLRGEDLAKRLEQGSLSVREALRIAIEVAKGVAHAHREGVVHRDLTPGNVFLCEDGQVKVLDFGMAHAFGRRRIDGGTLDYMAPEQRRGAPEDERTDVFALGIILFRMLSGELPFSRGDAARTERVPRLGVPELPALGALVARMLARDPVDRPREAGEVLAALAAFQHELPSGSSADPGARVRPLRARAPFAIRLTRPERRILFLALLGLGILIAAAGLGAYFLGSRAAHEQPPAAPDVPSIAVLPFADLSPQKDQEYFADGVAEEILNALSQVEGLRVIGRTSSFSFKGKSDDLRSIGRKLGVRSVLEGSIRREGSRARITAQLVNVVDEFSVWSQTYDRELTDVFAVQEDIARAVVAALAPRLMRADAPSVATHRTERPEVYDRYLVALQLHRQVSPESLRGAVKAYEEVVALDPNYAPGWGGLANAMYWVSDTTEKIEDRAELRRRALAAAEKAVALDPTLAEGWTARGLLRAALHWDWAGAQSDYDRALALTPGDAAVIRSYGHFILRPLGKRSEAIAAVRTSSDLDPLSTAPWANLAQLYVLNGQTEAARAAAERALQISPHNIYPASVVSLALLLEGRAEEALSAAKRNRNDGFRLTLAALAHHDLGHARQSNDALEALKAGFSVSMAYQIAEVHAWRGERDHAFEWLDRAYEQRDSGLMSVKMDELLRGLRDDSRYAALLRKMNLPLD